MKISKDFLYVAQREQHERSKTYWLLAKASQAFVLITGLVTTLAQSFIQIPPSIIAAFVSLVSACSVLLQWRSDYLKGMAQSFLRKYEFINGLDHEITDSEYLSIAADLPDYIAKRLFEQTESYFASIAESSPRRLIENLYESAFWNNNLSLACTWYFAVFTIALIIISFIILAGNSALPSVQPVGLDMLKAAISVLSFAFTAGVARQTFDFYRFHREAERIEKLACQLLEEDQILRELAIDLSYQHQLARAGAPLIPTLVFSRNKNRLNELWNTVHYSNSKENASN